MSEQPSPVQATDDVHDWISFESSEEMWLFDVTFLTSRWSCIWDRGCHGIREYESAAAMEGCCSFGAHFSDEADLLRVQESAERLTPQRWQHYRPVGEAFSNESGEWTTVTVDDACVFHNRPGFAGGAGCALHAGAIDASEPPLEWKPDVCWQLPLRLEHHEDENGRTVSTLRPWRRHDWGDAGADFASWCTDQPDAYRGSRTVFESLEDELRAMIGDARYDQLAAALQNRQIGTPVEAPIRRVRS